jgi:DNA repair protein RadC
MKKIKYKIITKEYTLKIAEKLDTAISKPEILFEALKDDFNPLQEELYVLSLNVKHQIINKHLVVRGGHSSMTVVPADILRMPLIDGCNKIIIAHNHPSGDPEPSEEDITFTRKIKEGCKFLGIDLLDHLIYVTDDYYSFKKNNLI